MAVTASESTFEQATIERLQQLGYRYQHGAELDRSLQAVVLVDDLRRYLQQRYRQLPAAAIEQAIESVRAPEGLTLERRNLAFQRLLREGLTVRYEEEHEEQFAHLYLADFEHPERNDFLVVNQLTVEGGESGNRRRPDLVLSVNQGFALNLRPASTPSTWTNPCRATT